MNNFSKENRHIIYLSDSYIRLSYIYQKSRADHSTEVEFLSKGQTATIIHVGGEMGFTLKALLTWKSGKPNGYYCDQINHYTFMNWTLIQLAPDSIPHFVIVIQITRRVVIKARTLHLIKQI